MDYRSIDEVRKDIGLYLMDYYNWQRPQAANTGGRLPLQKKNLIYCPVLVDHYELRWNAKR